MYYAKLKEEERNSAINNLCICTINWKKKNYVISFCYSFYVCSV